MKKLFLNEIPQNGYGNKGTGACAGVVYNLNYFVFSVKNSQL